MTIQYQAQLPLGNLPFHLVLISDGTVAFVLHQHFKLIHDDHPKDSGKVVGIYDTQGFSLNGEAFLYSTKYAYKEMPTLLKWLQEQELEMPN